MSKPRVTTYLGTLICAAVFLVPLGIIASSWPVDWEAVGAGLCVGVLVYLAVGRRTP